MFFLEKHYTENLLGTLMSTNVVPDENKLAVSML
jgi:hypothetical protein